MPRAHHAINTFLDEIDQPVATADDEIDAGIARTEFRNARKDDVGGMQVLRANGGFA